MIQEFVDRFMERKPDLEKIFHKKHPDKYRDVVKAVVSILDNGKWGNVPDPKRIHEIDDGHYQGTLVFVIGEQGYQPNDYWYVKVDYGSCSGCDTLEAIRGYTGETPTDKQVKDYVGLALNIVQGLKKMGDDE